MNGSTSVCHPVLGELIPWKMDGLNSDFDEFVTPQMQGLALVTGRRVEILAMAAHSPGHGHGGAFLDALKDAYDIIDVWDVLNSDLIGMLKRRGFVPHVEWRFRERLDGYRWARSASQPSPETGR